MVDQNWFRMTIQNKTLYRQPIPYVPYRVYRYDGHHHDPEGLNMHPVQSVRDPRKPRFGFEATIGQ